METVRIQFPIFQLKAKTEPVFKTLYVTPKTGTTSTRWAKQVLWLVRVTIVAVEMEQ